MGRKKNIKLWNHLMKELDDFEIKAGWFENTRYDADTPVAGIAAVQNYGVEINQKVTPKQRAFLHYAGIHLKETTENLHIVIPPRPFMDNAKKRIQGSEGKQIILQELLRVFEGRQTMEQATNRLGLWEQGIIQEEIKKIQTPPLSANTISMRNKQYKRQSKNSSTKPLNSSGIMFNTVQYEVTKK